MPTTDPTHTATQAGHVCSTAELGPWQAERDAGYNAHTRPWVLRRRNPNWWGGIETMQTTSHQERRWATEGAAKKAADHANGPNTSYTTPVA